MLPYHQLAVRRRGLPLAFWIAGAPLYLRSHSKGDAWHVRTYDDVLFVDADPTGRFSRAGLLPPSVDYPLKDMAWLLDGQAHDAFRRAAKPPFHERVMPVYEGLVWTTARKHLDRVKTQGGQFDLVQDLALPFAEEVIRLVIQAHGEIPDFWTELVRITEYEDMNSYPPDNGMSARLDALVDAQIAAGDFQGPFGQLLKLYARGGLVDDPDLARRLVRAYRLGIPFAGTDTVAHTLDNVLRQIRRHGLWNRTVDAARRRDFRLLQRLIDEAMRLDPAFPASAAQTTTRVTLPSGVTLPPDVTVVTWFSAANRDPGRYRQPGRFLPGRPPHLSFGWGPHVCWGAPLASLELRVMVCLLLSELAGLRPQAWPPHKIVTGRVKRNVRSRYAYAA